MKRRSVIYKAFALTLVLLYSLSFQAVFALGFSNGGPAMIPTIGNTGGNSGCSWDPQTKIYCMLAPLGDLIGSNGQLNIGNGGLSTYLNTMFRAGVAVATGLAVIMIVIGGLQYASTDAINGKSEGKEKITQALLGLLLALISVILLNQINPQLLQSDLGIQNSVSTGGINATNVQLDGGSASPGAGGVGQQEVPAFTLPEAPLPM